MCCVQSPVLWPTLLSRQLYERLAAFFTWRHSFQAFTLGKGRIMRNLMSILTVIFCRSNLLLFKTSLFSWHRPVFLMPSTSSRITQHSSLFHWARETHWWSLFFQKAVAENGHHQLWFYFTIGLFVQVCLWLWVENQRRHCSWGVSLDPSVSASCCCLSSSPVSGVSLPHFASIWVWVFLVSCDKPGLNSISASPKGLLKRINHLWSACYLWVFFWNPTCNFASFTCAKELQAFLTWQPSCSFFCTGIEQII